MLIGIASSGPHSNGYSLIRKIYERAGRPADHDLGDGVTLVDALMAPTRLYVKPVLSLLADLPIAAMAHITGGGLTENPPRVLPSNTKAVIDTDSWRRPAIFQWLQRQGGVADAEMWRTFNCGVGLVVCVAADVADTALTSLRDAGETAWQLGHIAAGDGEPFVEFKS